MWDQEGWSCLIFSSMAFIRSFILGCPRPPLLWSLPRPLVPPLPRSGAPRLRFKGSALKVCNELREYASRVSSRKDTAGGSVTASCSLVLFGFGLEEYLWIWAASDGGLSDFSSSSSRSESVGSSSRTSLVMPSLRFSAFHLLLIFTVSTQFFFSCFALLTG